MELCETFIYFSICWILTCYNQEKQRRISKRSSVESFELDHTAVKAPYVRLIGEETGPGTSSPILIFAVQPNENAIAWRDSHDPSTFLQCLFANASMGWLIVPHLDVAPVSYDHVGQHSSTEIAKVIKVFRSICQRRRMSSCIGLGQITRTTSLFSAKEWIVAWF